MYAYPYGASPPGRRRGCGQARDKHFAPCACGGKLAASAEEHTSGRCAGARRRACTVTGNEKLNILLLAGFVLGLLGYYLRGLAVVGVAVGIVGLASARFAAGGLVIVVALLSALAGRLHRLDNGR